MLISRSSFYDAIPYESDPEVRKVRELHESKRQACWGGSLETVRIVTSKGDQRVRLLSERECDDSSGDGGAPEEADRHRTVPQGHSSPNLTIVTCILLNASYESGFSPHSLSKAWFETTKSVLRLGFAV